MRGAYDLFQMRMSQHGCCYSEGWCCNADSAQVAIFDATNSTEQRRQLLVSPHSQS